MRAVYVERFDPDHPLEVIRVGERPEPVVPEGWVRVRVEAASVNHHDVWSARGVGLRPEHLPMILGCDAAGRTEDGRAVVVYPVVRDNLGASVLSERHQGCLAEYVAVPEENLVDRPEELSARDAACLPTAWLTAYQMLVERAEVAGGETVLVQGAGGGLSDALVAIGRALGCRMWVTSRSEEKGAFAVSRGADSWFPTSERLPERVDAVMDSVGAATWEHSLRSLRPGGCMVVSGATSGYRVEIDVARIFALQLRILGSSMGTVESLVRTLDLCVSRGLRPSVDSVVSLGDARTGFQRMIAGDVSGKLVVEMPDASQDDK